MWMLSRAAAVHLLPAATTIHAVTDPTGKTDPPSALAGGIVR